MSMKPSGFIAHNSKAEAHTGPRDQCLGTCGNNYNKNTPKQMLKT